MKEILVSNIEIAKNMTKNGHMYGEEIFTQINLTGDDFMPFKRNKAVVHVRKSRHQSQKMNKPGPEIYSWDLVWIDESGKRKQKTIHCIKRDADTEALRIALEIQKILNIGLEALHVSITCSHDNRNELQPFLKFDNHLAHFKHRIRVKRN